MDPILDAAILEEKTLLAQRGEIDAKLAKLKDFLAIHAELSARVGQASPIDKPVVRPSAAMSSDGARIATSAEVVSFSELWLANGDWMTTEAIYEGLTASGFTIKAMHPITRVSQILSASQKFQTQRGKGWALKLQNSSAPVATQDRSVHDRL